jgi:hypothetical protein
MITELTKEQEEQMEVFRDISMSVGLATGPTNREVVIPLFKQLYRDILKRAEPNIFIFVKSPAEAKKILNVLTEDKTEVLHHKWTMETNDAFVEELKKIPSGNENFSTHSYGYGSNESYWIYYYNYMRDVLGVTYDPAANDGLNLFAGLAKNSGWHYLAEDAVVICDRPSEIHMENNQLHNEEGPSCLFADGHAIYNINGHRVTKQIVEDPRSITIEQIASESNNETKRIMIERYGVEEYFAMTAAKIIDKDRLNLAGSATRLLVEDDQGNRWLCCSDGSTGRMYYLPAGECNTCKEAHEQMSGISEDNIIAEC